jgi:NDP-sugar pyrophosphorylase family protein
MKAFLLGAGLGTRLRPLTNRLPKPLVPFFDKPLIRHAFDACRAVGCDDLAINIHHLPEMWRDGVLGIGGENWLQTTERGGNGETVMRATVAGVPLRLFHEPLLLETGGGLRNVRQWLGGGDALIHNGDIFSTIDLAALMSAHRASGFTATLALRSQGTAQHIARDAATGQVLDIRNRLGRAEGTHVFTGIYCMNGALLDELPEESVISVIPAFLRLATAGMLGSVLLDEGAWFDLGERESYLDAHQLPGLSLPDGAVIATTAEITRSVIGKAAVIGEGARLKDCVVWPGCEVAAGADLERCIVYSGQIATGMHRNADL